MPKYLQLIRELDLRLVFALDTHVHADHVPRAQYDSLFNKLLRLPDETPVYPAHDYKGWTVSTIGEERANNPRLQVTSEQQYVDLMNGLKLANPKLMDIAVPAKLSCGLGRSS